MEAGADSTLLEASVTTLELVGRMTSEGAGELPVGTMDGSVVGRALVVSGSVSAGVSEVAAEEGEDVVGVKMSETGGRIPVGVDGC